jgi:hypothetical protein
MTIVCATLSGAVAYRVGDAETAHLHRAVAAPDRVGAWRAAPSRAQPRTLTALARH